MGLPVPVAAYFRDGTRQRQSLDRERDEQTLAFVGAAAIDSVVIDPEREFPLVVPPPEVDSARLADLVEALPWTGGGARALRLYRRAVALDTRDVDVLRKLGLTLVDARRYEDALAAFDRIVQVNPDTTSIWGFGALAWRGLLNDLLGRRAAAVESYRQALAVPGTPTLQHSQFGLTLDRDFIEQRLRTPFVWH
jgi:tetratricopeptide (TPR) repeat protein